jgi:hypothetical protein
VEIGDERRERYTDARELFAETVREADERGGVAPPETDERVAQTRHVDLAEDAVGERLMSAEARGALCVPLLDDARLFPRVLLDQARQRVCVPLRK